VKAPPYELDPLFEQVVLYYACNQPRFWAKCGYALDPECLEHKHAKLLIATCRTIAKEVGHGPDGSLLIIQRLKRQVAAGKVGQDTLVEVSDFFDSVELLNLPGWDLVANEIVPILRKRLRFQAIQAAHGEYAQDGDFEEVGKALEHAARLGNSEIAQSVTLRGSAFDRLGAIRLTQRLSYGIAELDASLDGGIPRQSLGVFLGDSGGGKSMHLASQAGTCLMHQLFVGMVTLELPVHVQLARLIAHITGVEVNGILDNELIEKEARRRFELVEPHLGLLELADFPPQVTSVRDILEWIQLKEEDHGRKMDALIVDYGDKLYAPQVKDNNEYVAMRFVYESLRRDIAVAKDMWVWTASQATRRGSKDSKRTLDLDNAADSMHKIRVADVVLTLNPEQDDASLMNYFVAKNRLGRARMKIGPVFTDFARARAAQFSSELGPW
jgi:hypothetical protein